MIPELVEDKISDRAKQLLVKVTEFVENEILPRDVEYNQFAETHAWEICPVVEELKLKAKQQGLWNLFLPKSYSEGQGLTNLEYALMAEQMGRTAWAPEIFNCGAPDTGNMEILAKYGNSEQKQTWLVPLLEGRIRSAFCMTEKGVASSDATNIRMTITRDEANRQYILSGTKWWSSGAGDPRCKVLFVMGKTKTVGDAHKQQSVIIVPRDTPGVEMIRPMQVFGFDDRPHGHFEVKFNDVRVPFENILLGEGRGFEIVQGRLGPGRLHHCMRAIGSANEGLRWMIARIQSPERKTFGKLLKDHGTIMEWVARSKIDIDYGRLLVLQAAHKLDIAGHKRAISDIAKAKIECPNICQRVLDRAIQVFGAEGVSQDTPLARAWANNRTLRIADGPDEVHMNQLAKRVLVEKL